MPENKLSRLRLLRRARSLEAEARFHETVGLTGTAPLASMTMTVSLKLMA